MSSLDNIVLRTPTLEDGVALSRLIANCPPLDTNSDYCNLLQCSHFANTSVAADRNGELVGFISGYILPEHHDTLFIWQVAVAAQIRKAGLASHMLNHLLARPQCTGINYLEATTTADNNSSVAMLEGLARQLSADITASLWLNAEIHFAGAHDSETLVRIGPIIHT